MTIYSMAECEQLLRDNPAGCLRLMTMAHGKPVRQVRGARGDPSAARINAAKARWARWRAARKAAA